MRTEKLQLSDVRYNPERSAFQAVVKIHDDGESFDYPTEMIAPLHAEFKLIARGLTAKAQRAHRSDAPALRMRTAAAPVQTMHRELRETPLMMRMLRALAA